MVDKVMQAQVVDTRDGHGAQFEIRISNAREGFGKTLLESIKSEGDCQATLYVDNLELQGDTLVISLCRGGLHLTEVRGRRNVNRADNRFFVIIREEIDREGDCLRHINL